MASTELMIKSAQKYFASIPPVFIDGLLYCLIAFFGFNQVYLGGDEAAKYISPMAKFWINYVVGGSAATVGAIKMFRSTTYSDHQLEKDKQNETSITTTEVKTASTIITPPVGT